MGLKSKYHIYMFSIAALLLSIVACKRAGEEKTSSISIQIPQFQGSQKSVSVAGFPTAGTLCFMASISAPDIIGNTDSCAPSKGILSKFVLQNENIQLNDITMGADRHFEIFTYVSSSPNCPSEDPIDFKKLDYNKFYLVASVENVTLSKPDETIEISVAFPGAANSLFSQFNGTNCISTPTATYVGTKTKVNLGGGVMSNANYNLHHSIGNAVTSVEMSGANYKIHVK